MMEKNNTYIVLFATKEILLNIGGGMTNMGKYKIVAIFGKSAAGKDTIQNWLVDNCSDIKKIVSHTTRRPRNYEVDGKDYHFVTWNQFTDLVLSGKMLEAVEYQGNFYGSCEKELDETKINLAVFELDGISALQVNPEVDLMCIYINATNKERLMRALMREENPDCEKICSRFLHEEKIFNDLDFTYFTYDNHNSEYQSFPDLLKVIKDFGQKL